MKLFLFPFADLTGLNAVFFLYKHFGKINSVKKRKHQKGKPKIRQIFFYISFEHDSLFFHAK